MLYGEALRRLTIYTWGVVVIFPLMGIWHYGSSIAGRRYSLRTIAWLKPFVIGFVWAGVVHIYPLWYASVIHVEKFQMNETSVLAFLQTFIFISMLAIIFDLKDNVIDK